MRAIFLTRIVKGKGLDEIIAQTGREPLPTPYAMYEYAREIHERIPGWKDFILLDMGGATTDVYSAHDQVAPEGVMVRGLPEPIVKRTVEGDLGMRVSALSASETGSGLIAERLDHNADRISAFTDYIAKVSAEPDHLPDDRKAGNSTSCWQAHAWHTLANAMPGRSYRVHTCDGSMEVQIGRNLTQVRKVIGSGGWLSRAAHFNVGPWFKYRALDQQGKTVMLPHHVEYFRDEQYLFPLLANVARDFPEAAAHAGIRLLAQS